MSQPPSCHAVEVAETSPMRRGLKVTIFGDAER